MPTKVFSIIEGKLLISGKYRQVDKIEVLNDTFIVVTYSKNITKANEIFVGRTDMLQFGGQSEF